MNNKIQTLDSRVINIESVTEIDEKLFPIFTSPEHKTYILNFTQNTAYEIFQYYHIKNQQPLGVYSAVKSYRQRECFKDGTAWTKTQILSFILDCTTEEILQAKMGRPTDSAIDDKHIHIDDMQTRWTHYTEFMNGAENNYKFSVKELKDALAFDKKINMNSLRDIRKDLEDDVDFLENQKNPIKFTYPILTKFPTLKQNFDNTIFSAKLSIKPNSYLAKGFINDNMTTTTLTQPQILMTKGTVLPNEDSSWTTNIRPIIDKYNGRKGTENSNNDMFNGTRKNPPKHSGQAIGKAAYILKGKPNTGQLSSLMMGQILMFQDHKGSLNLRKKFWEYDKSKLVLKSWRQAVHTSDNSQSSAYNEWVTDRFTNAKMITSNDLKTYKDKSLKIVSGVNKITHLFDSKTSLRNQTERFKRFFLKELDDRKSNKDGHPQLQVLNKFSFSNLENAKMLYSELLRNAFTYDITIDENFILEYLKTLNSVMRKIYSTDKDVNKLTHLTNIETGDSSSTYEARLPVWVEMFEGVEKSMKNNAFYKSNYRGTRNVKQSEKDKLKDLFIDTYNELGIVIQDDILYDDAEWGKVTLDNFQDGHTISNKNYGSADLSSSVIIHPKRNEIAGSVTGGETTLPIPAKFYQSIIDGLENKLNIPDINRNESRRIKKYIEVLEVVIEKYELEEV